MQYLSESRRWVQVGSERWVNGLMRRQVSIYVSLERVPHVTAEGYVCTFGWLYFQWEIGLFLLYKGVSQHRLVQPDDQENDEMRRAEYTSPIYGMWLPWRIICAYD